MPARVDEYRRWIVSESRIRPWGRRSVSAANVQFGLEERPLLERQRYGPKVEKSTISCRRSGVLWVENATRVQWVEGSSVSTCRHGRRGHGMSSVAGIRWSMRGREQQ